MSNTESHSIEPQPFVIGWEEWLSLPALGLPAIKAKVDTGAKTSALHAFLIEPFNEGGRPFVRFGIHPIPGRDDIEVFCTSPLVDRREVTSSNGDKESRYVISTAVTMGARTWDIEVTLTNREGMAYRMLLGRQAIRDGMLVDPAASFRQRKLSHRLYEPNRPARSTEPRPFAATSKPIASNTSGLRIAVLTRQLSSSSNRRLLEAAGPRGHTIELIDLATLTLSLAADGPPLAATAAAALRPFDFVVPRFVGGNGSFGAAVVRALEGTGCQGLNTADALDLLRNPLALAQALAQAGARQVQGGVTEADWPERLKSSAKATPELSVLTVGGRAIAGVALHDSATSDVARADASADFAQAERIARMLGLGLAAVDFGSDDDGRIVVRVSGSPRLGLFERVTGVRAADTILQELEARGRLAAANDASSDNGFGED
jgi:hypothetical protein